MKMRITLVCAMARNHVIGKDNKMPWQGLEEYKWDMNNFRKITTGKYVIMGYNTFKSMNFKPLKNRNNVVISSVEKMGSFIDEIKDSVGLGKIEVYNSVHDAICNISWKNIYNNELEICVIGGSKIINEAFDNDLIDNIVLTRFDQEFDGDRYFPLEKINGRFDLVGMERHENGTIATYKRNNFPYMFLREESD